MSATHLSLFSGIGGFDLAAQWAGFRTILFCENDPFCQGVLAQHWPEVTIHGDIRTLDGSAWRGATILTGGFPCQPFSNAGQRHGESDDRFLWPEMLRVVQAARPRWLVGENVAGLVNLALDRVCADLEASGYEVGPPLVFPACAVGAWHQRQRVWIIAHANEGGRGADEPHLSARQSHVDWRSALSDADGVWQCERTERIPEGGDGARNLGAYVPDAAGVREQSFGRLEFATGSDQARHIYPRQSQSGVGRGPDGVSGWLDGSWERGIPRLSLGTVNRGRRLKALGNAVVPAQAFPILQLIAEWEGITA